MFGLLMLVGITTALTEFSVILSDGAFRVTPRIDSQSEEVAWGTWEDSYDKTGWSILGVHTNPAFDDITAATAAGYFEGQMTAFRIEQYAFNMDAQTYNVSDSMKRYFSANAEWMDSMIKISENLRTGTPDRKIWYHQSLLLAQMEGLYQGYLAGRALLKEPVLSSPLTREHILLLNIGCDLDDLESYDNLNATGGGGGPRGQDGGKDVGSCGHQGDDAHQDNADCQSQTPPAKSDPVPPVLGVDRCSAIVRLTDDNQDIFIGQETWALLQTMLRIWKLYDFPFLVDGGSTERVPGRRVSFSAYPGTLASLDDFYVLSSGLVVIETTLGNNNPRLYEDFLTPFSLYEFYRNIIANRLADTGASWGPVYKKFNSGTYDNMNIILDYKLFVPGSASLANGTLIIVEQIPGHVITNDVSQMLSRDRYFASYNIALDPAIRRISGVDLDEYQHGTISSYDQAPRAQIFRRDAPKTQTLDDVKKLMRSCDFKNDPFSSQLPTCEFLGWTNCTPAQTAQNCIATRGDLNPVDGIWALPSFGHRNHVASDAKISHFQAYNPITLAAEAVCGPVGSRDNPESTPTFRWSTSDFESSVPHIGHPDAFDFDWQHIEFAK